MARRLHGRHACRWIPAIRDVRSLVRRPHIGCTLPCGAVEAVSLTYVILIGVVRALLALSATSFRLVVALGAIRAGSITRRTLRGGLTRSTIGAHSCTQGGGIGSSGAFLAMAITLRSGEVSWRALIATTLAGHGLICPSRAKRTHHCTNVYSIGTRCAVLTPSGAIVGCKLPHSA